MCLIFSGTDEEKQPIDGINSLKCWVCMANRYHAAGSVTEIKEAFVDTSWQEQDA